MVLQTDSVSSFRELVHVQLHYPISLDPLTYHALTHFCCDLFGAHSFSLRLPSLLGFLVMQFCLYRFVKRIAGESAGLIALAIPGLSATFFYAVEGRPYGILLGLLGVWMVSYQELVRHGEKHSGAARYSSWALFGVASSLALLLNTHYFAVLLLVPIYGAEIFRSLVRRRFDLPVAGSILLGTLAAVGEVPFSRAAAEYRQHYYNIDKISLHVVSQAYSSMLVGPHLNTISGTVLIVAALFAFAWLCAEGLRHKLPLVPAEAAFLILLACLPFFGYLLARFVTHSIEPRYVIGAIESVAVLLSIMIARGLCSIMPARSVAGLLALALLIAGLGHIKSAHSRSSATLATLRLTPTLRNRILSTPSQQLFFEDVTRFDVATLYESDPWMRSHISLIYSRPLELALLHRDTMSLVALHMAHFTDLHIIPYDKFERESGEDIVVDYDSGIWGNWADTALAQPGVERTPLGSALGGEVSSVRFQR